MQSRKMGLNKNGIESGSVSRRPLRALCVERGIALGAGADAGAFPLHAPGPQEVPGLALRASPGIKAEQRIDTRLQKTYSLHSMNLLAIAMPALHIMAPGNRDIDTNEQSRIRTPYQPAGTTQHSTTSMLLRNGINRPVKISSGFALDFQRSARRAAGHRLAPSRHSPWRARSATARASLDEPFNDSGLSRRIPRPAA